MDEETGDVVERTALGWILASKTKRFVPRRGKELERPVSLLAGGVTRRAVCDLGHTLCATGLERLPWFNHGKRSRHTKCRRD